MSSLAFYKRWFGAVVGLALIQAIAIGVLVAAFVIVKSQRVEREYFAFDWRTGRMVRMIPVSEPYISDGRLLTWAQQCVIDANSYDFVNWRAQFQQHSHCFTEDGWAQFNSAIDKAGTLQTVKDQRLIVSSVATGPSVITKRGILNGFYSWEIQMPVNVSYQNGSAATNTTMQKLLVTLHISRIPTDQSEEGVGITQYIGDERP